MEFKEGGDQPRELSREEIRMVRSRADLTQPELAQRLGVSLRTVMRWEGKDGGSPPFLWMAFVYLFGPDCLTFS